MTGEQILLADDEPSSLQLARHLEQEGFRVQPAADGEAALQAVKQHRPALVVLNRKKSAGSRARIETVTGIGYKLAA